MNTELKNHFFCYFRCAFHAYLDSACAKQLENGGQSLFGNIDPNPTTSNNPTGGDISLILNGSKGAREYQQSVIEVSEDSINSIEKVEEWTVLSNGTDRKHIASSSYSNGLKNMPNGIPSPENGKTCISFPHLTCFFFINATTNRYKR